jgi:hypothetical protein
MTIKRYAAPYSVRNYVHAKFLFIAVNDFKTLEIRVEAARFVFRALLK